GAPAGAQCGVGGGAALPGDADVVHRDSSGSDVDLANEWLLSGLGCLPPESGHLARRRLKGAASRARVVGVMLEVVRHLGGWS
ncbi:hypothetical protein CYMTET_51427, partial [Cymbomonas tetramitiformis]